MRPRLIILGHARHGKDTVAEMLRDRHGFTFASSSLFVAERVIMPASQVRMGVSYAGVEECYADRVNHRAAWFDLIAAYNLDDPARLAREIFAENDVYVGMRNPLEYAAAKDLADWSIWVDASGRGIPAEPASSNGIACDPRHMAILNNDWSLEALRENVDAIVDGMRMFMEWDDEK